MPYDLFLITSLDHGIAVVACDLSFPLDDYGRISLWSFPIGFPLISKV